MAALYDTAASTLPKATPGGADVVTINFVEDGLSAFGKVWVRGEELSVKRGTPSWEATCDREGNSWMELTEPEQYDRWGEVRFREGLWAGRPLTAIEDAALTDDDKAALAKAEAEKAAVLNKASEKPAQPRKRGAAKKAASAAPQPVEASEEDAPASDDFLDELNKD